jgi:hypothetical protein
MYLKITESGQGSNCITEANNRIQGEQQMGWTNKPLAEQCLMLQGNSTWNPSKKD